MHLKGAWKLKYEAKGIRCVRRTTFTNITPYVEFEFTSIIDVLNVILHHDFSIGVGIHFIDLEKSEEYEDLLVDYDYSWEPDGLKVKGKK